MRFRSVICILLLACVAMPLAAQVDKREVRSGNRRFKKGNYKEAEIDYRKAVVKDSMSIAGQYDLASSLYRQKDYEGAGKTLDAVKDIVPGTKYADRYWFNKGDAALQQKDWDGAMDAFKQSLLVNPGDIDAKENYIYAKKMKQKEQQQQQNQDQNQNKDQNKDQNNQDQNQNKDQQQNKNQDQNKNQQGQQPQPQNQKISRQQAQQMLQAIQAKEKETQDKVNKEKAAVLQSRQKEKNW